MCVLSHSVVSDSLRQAGTLEWVAIPFSRESCPPRNRTWVSCTASRFFTIWATRKPASLFQVMYATIFPNVPSLWDRMSWPGPVAPFFSKALTRRGSFRHYRQNSNTCTPLCSPACLPSEVPHTGVLQTGPVGGSLLDIGAWHAQLASALPAASPMSSVHARNGPEISGPFRDRSCVPAFTFISNTLSHCLLWSIFVVVVQWLTRVQLVTPWTAACQAPLSMGFSRQEHWGGLPFPVFLRDIHKS